MFYARVDEKILAFETQEEAAYAAVPFNVFHWKAVPVQIDGKEVFIAVARWPREFYQNCKHVSENSTPTYFVSSSYRLDDEIRISDFVKNEMKEKEDVIIRGQEHDATRGCITWEKETGVINCFDSMTVFQDNFIAAFGDKIIENGVEHSKNNDNFAGIWQSFSTHYFKSRRKAGVVSAQQNKE